MRRGCIPLLMGVAVHPRLSNIPEQRAVTVITPMDRILTLLRIVAAQTKVAAITHLPILRRMIAQIVRFVRQFPLREFSRYRSSCRKSSSRPASSKRPNVQIPCWDSVCLCSAVLRQLHEPCCPCCQASLRAELRLRDSCSRHSFALKLRCASD